MNNRERIMKYVGAGVDKHNIPPSLILTVGFLESHFGCNPRSGGSWGSPIDRNHRGIAGTPIHTARDLANARKVCGSWFGALARYQSGLCHRRSLVASYTPQYAFNVAWRMENVARAHSAVTTERPLFRNTN
jgi:hypothetical protein